MTLKHWIPAWLRGQFWFALAGFVSFPLGAAERDHWLLCTQSASVGTQLEKIADRIGVRARQEGPAVMVRAVPHGDGSTEFLLAASTRLIDQLRTRLQDDRVPARRVQFELMSESEAGWSGKSPAGCRGVEVRIELLP